MSKYLLFLSALFLLTCESSERIWSNPNDPDIGIDPSAWAPSNLQAQVLNDSEIKLTWEQEEENIAGFRLERSDDSSSFSQIVELEENVTEYTDAGLSLDTDYTYRVKAFTDENESASVISNTTNTSFPSPSNLSAIVLSDSEVKLTWSDNCSFESGFRLERSTGGDYSQIAEVEADITEFTDTGLNYGTDYTYRVRAFTDENASGYATSNTTNTSFPSPTNLIATPVDDQSIQLTWTDNCSFESGFRLERSTGGDYSQIAEVEADITEFTDTGLNYGTDYTYRVRAFTDENASGYATSNTTNTSFPSPTNLIATPVDDQSIQLTWTDNCSFESGFRLERSTGGNYTQIAEVEADITEFTDTGLNYGTDYTYRVRAFTDENASGYATSNTTNTSFPSPTNLIATPVDDQSIQLTWTDNCSFESGFRLERSTGGDYSQIAEVEADITEFTDTGLNYGTDYTYRVKAFTDENESAYATSNTITMSIPSPSNLTATPIDDQSIQLTWTDNCGFENGFRLERSTGGNYTQIAEVGANVTEYTDTGLLLDTDYTYRVKAFTDVNESGYTNTAEMTLFYDCAGEFMGTAYENECGCVGGNTGWEADFCYGCTDPEAFNYDPDATIDDGSCYTVTDIDGNVYQTIIIGTQVWMAENLKVTHYRNGDAIPTGYSNSDWENLTTGAYAVYDGNESNADTYGYLYNWYAVADSRNIAPEGWHVPTDDEIKQLEMHLGMSQSEADDSGYRGTDEGGKLKEEGTAHWSSPNAGATNESGFTALPGGYRGYDYSNYYDMGSYGYFWSSTEIHSNSAWYRKLYYDLSGVYRGSNSKQYGFSVRCVRD